MRLGDGRPVPAEQPESVKKGLIAAAGVFVFACVWLLLAGIANVEITEYGLNYSLLTRKVERKTYPSGRYWIGPLNHFIRFPSIVTTVQFSDSGMQMDLSRGEVGERELRSRTKDGLDVHIELSFQYQLAAESIYELYTTFGGFYEYHNTLVRLAIDRLTESATNFSATEFFTERTLIGRCMEEKMVKDFEERLFATIFSFQLRTVGLPQAFEDAIQETEVKKQDVLVAMAEQNATRVSVETELMQAERRTRVTMNRAEGEAESVLLANAADIAQFKATQMKSADSYAALLGKLDSKKDDLLEYVEVRALRDHPSAKTVIGMGLSSPPAAAGA
mmetsp:Transcript_20628/g.59754  ORF Transcript_20628/g.59754 Transcript_20628/m.59754 type:complete len:333 (-) Transcript_20628:1-999(-)